MEERKYRTLYSADTEGKILILWWYRLIYSKHPWILCSFIRRKHVARTCRSDKITMSNKSPRRVPAIECATQLIIRAYITCGRPGNGSSAAAGSFNCRPTSSPVGLQRGFTQGVRESSDPLMNKFPASSLILPSASNVRHLIKLERVRNAFNFSRPLTNLSTADTISLRQQLWFFLNIDWY